MNNRKHTFGLAAWFSSFTAAGIAVGFSELNYRLLLVPRLPRFHSVPMIWWSFVCLVVVVFIIAMVLRPFNWLAVALSVAAGVDIAWIVIDAIRARNGLPVSHDLFFGTLEYLYSAAYRSVIVLVLFLVLAWPVSKAAALFR